MKYEVIVCTMNRPHDLETTLHSVFLEAKDVSRVIVVDASGEQLQSSNARTLKQIGGLDRTLHLRFDDRPSLARQRNLGIDAILEDTAVVHFLDDDVTVQTNYFEALNKLIRDEPAAVGAGGRLVEPDREPGAAHPARVAIAGAFMLDSRRPGRILPSGWTTSPQLHDGANRLKVEWLGGCCAYRRDLLNDVRFDARLEGYSLDEDLDFSFRASKHGSLWFTPDAEVVHHRSSANRMANRRLARDGIIHRYWFVRKNMSRISRLAFWWSMLGKRLALLTSSSYEAFESIEGFKEGIRAIRRRDHYLLADL